MTQTIPAVATVDWKKYYARFLMGLQGDPATSTIVNPGPITVQWDPRFQFFRVGEGGWIDNGSGRVPRAPDPDLRRESSPLIQDIDARVDGTRASPRYNGNTGSPLYSRGNFQKALILGDYSFVAPSTARVHCQIAAGEFNEDSGGSGRSPEIWELGLFCDHPEESGDYLMVAYCTFPVQIKQVGVPLDFFLNVPLGV